MKLVPNPAYAGMTPRILEVDCHDRTPFLTIECGECSAQMHVHESQVEGIRGQIMSRCQTCADPMLFGPGFFERAFQALRDEGWVAPKDPAR